VIALLQRVISASVVIEVKTEIKTELKTESKTTAEIKKGLLVFLGIERKDNEEQAVRLLHRLLNYRIFSDHDGKMNLSLRDIKGELLLVPQFTLAADTRKGLRPGFSTAATPQEGEQLYNYFLAQAMSSYDPVSTGQFGADMKISLINDGPVTFVLN